VILFIALREVKDKRRAGVIPLELLPRRCPICLADTIIGHGQRLRQSHDDQHEDIWVRSGICEPCRKTFTILPDWLAPSAPFTLHCRQQVCGHIAAGDTAEQATPHCKDPTRLPDHPQSADGHNDDSSAFGVGLTPESKTGTFCGRPPLLPGSGHARPYSGYRGKKSVNRHALDELKQQIPLLKYLQALDWHQARPIGFGRFLGLCPLHDDHKPSFLVDPPEELVLLLRVPPWR
jgi:hypothetical protein